MKNTRFFRTDKRAITIIEIMAAVFIFTIVGTLFVYGVTNINSLYIANNQMAAFISDELIASMHLLNNIRPARRATINGNRLTLEYCDQVSNPDVTYTLTGSRLKSGGTTVVEGVNAGQSSFSISGNVVTVDILFKYKNIKYPVRIRGKMRNA